MMARDPNETKDFFAWSDGLDYLVLRPLSHITLHWEARWDHAARRYSPEADSFADDLNAVIDLIAICPPPPRYHDHEDLLVERVIRDLRWPIQKMGSRWVGADYATILEQGAFRDLEQRDLIAAASGRVHAAIAHGQTHVDEMEEGHRVILTALMTIIIYHRYCDGSCLLYGDEDTD